MADHTDPNRFARPVAAVAGPIVAIASAWALAVPDPPATSGWRTLPNVALIIALLTVGAAAIDWLAGAITSVIAALALNYFHTQPYRTLRIDDGRDIASVVLLAALGLAVSAVTGTRVRHRIATLRRADSNLAGQAFAESLREDRIVPEVWAAAVDAAANDLGLVAARLERFAPAGMPQVGQAEERACGMPGTAVSLPAGGAVVRLRHRSPRGRWIVLTPLPGLAPHDVDRREISAFAQAVQLALDHGSPEPSVHDAPDVDDPALLDGRTR